MGRARPSFSPTASTAGARPRSNSPSTHRDELLEARPEPSGPVERRPQKRSTSGVAGVRLAFKNETAYIEANWVGEDGRSVTSYSVGRWGLRKATWQACKSRAVGLGVRNPERIQTMFETAYPNLQESLAAALVGAQPGVRHPRSTTGRRCGGATGRCTARCRSRSSRKRSGVAASCPIFRARSSCSGSV